MVTFEIILIFEAVLLRFYHVDVLCGCTVGFILVSFVFRLGFCLVVLWYWFDYSLISLCLSMKTTRFVDYICSRSTLFVHLRCFRIAGNVRTPRERKSEGLAQVLRCPSDWFFARLFARVFSFS